MKCEYCQHESEPSDMVQMYEQGVKTKKRVPICVDMIRCLERQLTNTPKRTPAKVLAGIR